MNTANDALNDALGSGDKLAISRASTAKWDEIRRDIAADALRGPSEWTPPSSHRVRVIEVHPEIVADLRDLLFEDDMQGVCYSEFIRRAIELLGPLRRLNPPGIGPAKYATLDGRFRIEQGANGAGSWTVSGDERLCVVAGLDHCFNTLREARETLAGSVYAKPHGWLHQTEDEIEEAYREALRTPVNAP